MTLSIFFHSLCNKFFNHETPELPNSRTPELPNSELPNSKLQTPDSRTPGLPDSRTPGLRSPVSELRISILLLIFLFLLIKTTTAQFQITPIAKFYQSGINISCYGAMDGEINLVVEGETGPYLFNWSNGSFSQKLQNLSAGDYTVVVTDINGQTETATITLYQPNELRVTLDPVVYDGGYHITAAGNNDGVIVAVVTGGTADYVYLWSNSTTQYKAGDLYAGPYTVTVTDMNACTASASVVLTQPTPLQVISITSPMNNGYNVSCKDGSDGAINLVVAGGVQSQPYTFRWSTGREEQNLSGIPAGNYSVRITDAAGASVVTQITLTEPPLFKISGMVPSLYPNGKNLSCNTCSNGSITVNTTGGVGTPTYLWETGPITQTITNQQAGTYFVTVTDANGCMASSSKSLVAPERDDWSMFGNNGTNPNSQFMGTTDSVDFVFRTKNTERLRIKGNGSLIVNGFSGTSTRLLRVDANGNVEPGDPVVSPGTISGLCDATSRLTLAWRKTNTLGPWNDYDLMNCSQRFGFGVWTPQERIHVNGFSRHSSSSASNYLNVGHDGNAKINSYGAGLFINYDSPQNVSVNTGTTQGDFSTGGNTFLSTLSGKVGIKNSNPHDDIEIGDLFTLHNDGVNCWMGYNSIFQGINKRIIDGYASRITFGNQGDIFLGAAGNGLETEPINTWRGLIIDNEGKIGIGTLSPSKTLTVNGDLQLLSTNDHNSLQISSTSPPSRRGIFVEDESINGNFNFFIHNYNGQANFNFQRRDDENQNPVITTLLQISKNGTLRANGPEFTLGIQDGKNQGSQIENRALVHGDNDELIINQEGDFEGGVIVKCTDESTKAFRVYDESNATVNFQIMGDGVVYGRELNLMTNDFTDFVFDNSYSLISLDSVAKFIECYNHLPNLQSANEIQKNGGYYNVGDLQLKMLQKIEELTLYIIDLQKMNNELNRKIETINR